MKGQAVWCISEEHGAMEGSITDALADGYIVSLPKLVGRSPTAEYWVLKKHSNVRLRPRAIG